jgi:signal transduction histidine kinase
MAEDLEHRDQGRAKTPPQSAAAALSRKILLDLLEQNMADRRNLSRCLHDTVVQNLVLLSLSPAHLPGGSGQAHARVLDLAEQASREVRVLGYIFSAPAPGRHDC